MGQRGESGAALRNLSTKRHLKLSNYQIAQWEVCPKLKLGYITYVYIMQLLKGQAGTLSHHVLSFFSQEKNCTGNETKTMSQWDHPQAKNEALSSQSVFLKTSRSDAQHSSLPVLGHWGCTIWCGTLERAMTLFRE